MKSNLYLRTILVVIAFLAASAVIVACGKSGGFGVGGKVIITGGSK